MLEQFLQCPYCLEEISVLIDPSIQRQQYIEDCEVCYNPIEVNSTVEQNDIVLFEAKSIEQ